MHKIKWSSIKEVHVEEVSKVPIDWIVSEPDFLFDEPVAVEPVIEQPRRYRNPSGRPSSPTWFTNPATRTTNTF